jgi:PKD repeat protein
LVSLTGISIDGCKDSSTKYIQVWPKPIANFFHTPKDTCFGPANVILTNLSIGANSYNWSFGNGNTAITKDAIQFYSGLGVYPIKLIVSNTFQCKDSFESTFEILNQPEASFDFNDSSGCLPYSVPFKNSSKGGSEYTWYFGDGDTSSEVSPTHIYTLPGIFSVSLVVKSGVVCRDSFTFYKPIRVDSKSGIKFTSQLIEDKKPYREVEFNTTAFNKFIFEWKFGDGNTGFGEQVFHKYAERDSGCFNVELKVFTTNNCDTFYTDTVCLPAYWEGLSVPNAFSPDYGTEQVRVFKPAGVELIKYEIKIFNKWGELVWQSNALVNGSPAEGWNGIDLNGNPCMQGNYIWMIEAEFTSGKTWQGQDSGSKHYNRRGTLTLIR